MTQMTSQPHIDMGAQAAGLMRAQTAGTQSLIRVQARDIKVVEGRAVQEAQLLGYSALYGWGSGQDRIEGPAWPLTKSLMRVYGNCSLDMDPVQDLPDAWVFTARAVDMETGYSISRQFRQSKNWKVYGKHDDARKEDVRFQIGQSKALRNVALAFLPDWLVDRAMDAAKGGMRERIEALISDQVKKNPDLSPDDALALVVKAAFAKLASIGITEERALYTLGRKNLPGVTVEDLVLIRGGIAAIEKGTDTADDVFPNPPAADQASTAGTDLLTRISKTAAKPAQPAQETPAKPEAPAEPPAAKEPAKAYTDPRSVTMTEADADAVMGAAASAPDQPKPDTSGAGGSMFPDPAAPAAPSPSTVDRAAAPAKPRIKPPKHPV